MEKNSALVKLNLSINNITGEAADDIAAAISSNTKLQEINISVNNFPTADVRKIVQALQGTNALESYALGIIILLVKQQMILQLLFPVIQVYKKLM